MTLKELKKMIAEEYSAFQNEQNKGHTFITYYPQFQNPSLEDATGVGISPWGYSKCTTGGPSSPDIQPGIWNVFLQPSDGFSYVGFICRANNTWESFTTQLIFGRLIRHHYLISFLLRRIYMVH